MKTTLAVYAAPLLAETEPRFTAGKEQGRELGLDAAVATAQGE